MVGAVYVQTCTARVGQMIAIVRHRVLDGLAPWFRVAAGHGTIPAMSEISGLSPVNVCQPCGACCAHFRVSFYWAEADDTPGGFVPAQLTEQLTPHLRCMQGTSQKTPRCTALDGQVGQWVACRIYEHRPMPCREVMPGSAQCLKARAAHGMGPLPPGFEH